MLRDIEQGGRIEAEHIVGDLLKRAAAASATPLLSTAYAHLRAYQARRRREADAPCRRNHPSPMQITVQAGRPTWPPAPAAL